MSYILRKEPHIFFGVSYTMVTTIGLGKIIMWQIKRPDTKDTIVFLFSTGPLQQ
jgi:hypothetical protein